MARQYFPWCPCCKQCTRRYNFTESPSFGWDLVDDPSGSTPVHIAWDHVNYRIDIDGEGSATVRVTGNPKTIYVAAEVLSLTSGSAGVTIRRVDSAESISLWWMGGTSYELRHGTTVLESITGSGSGEIKLELATPRDATTDVLVYIGGTLVHTESTVAFVMPDVLHLGMIVDGEATFEWAEVSPCPVSTCKPYDQVCYGDPWTSQTLTVPVMWHVNIPWPSDHGSNSWPDPLTDCMDPSGPGFDVLYPQDIYFKLGTDVVYYDHDGEGAWATVGGCGHVPFTPSKITYSSQYSATIETPYSLPPIPEGKFPMEYWGFCYWDGFTTVFPHSNDKFNDDFTSYTYGAWQLNIEWRNLGTFETPLVEYRIRVGFYDSGTIEYVSAWISHDGDPVDSSLTLTLGTNTSMYSGWVSSVTLEPNGGTLEFALRAMGCGRETCTPPVTPQPGGCYLINLTLADEDGGAWYYSLPLSLQYDEGSGSWYWEGGSLSAYPYVHDTCGPLPEFDIKIHCVEPEEGASKQWVMDLTTSGGSDRYPMTWFDMEETIPEFEGATDLMCSGQTWDLYAFNLRLETSEWQFGSCSWPVCATPTSPIIRADISVSCSGESGSGGASGPLVFQATTSSLPVGVDPGDVSGLSFWSPLPSSLNTGILKMAFLYVENGTAKIQITDASGNPIPDMGTTVSYSCDPSDGKPAFVDTSETLYDWGFPGPYTANQFGLCDGESSGFGGWEVTFP